MADVVVDKSFPSDCLVPKHETGVSQFLKKYPKYNGEGVTVAVLDSGVDPKSCGLEVRAFQLCRFSVEQVLKRMFAAFVQCHYPNFLVQFYL